MTQPRFVLVPRQVQHPGNPTMYLIEDTRWDVPVKMGMFFELDLAQAIADTLNRRQHDGQAHEQAQNSDSDSPPQQNTEGSKATPPVSERTGLRHPSRRDHGAIPGGSTVAEHQAEIRRLSEVYRESRSCERCDGNTAPMQRDRTGALTCFTCYQALYHPRR